MATVTRQLCSWENDAAVAYLFYDDTTLRVNDARVVNGLTRNVHITITKSGNVVFDQSFLPGTTDVAIPTQGNKRIDIVDNGRGMWMNVAMMFYVDP